MEPASRALAKLSLSNGTIRLDARIHSVSAHRLAMGKVDGMEPVALDNFQPAVAAEDDAAVVGKCYCCYCVEAASEQEFARHSESILSPWSIFDAICDRFAAAVDGDDVGYDDRLLLAALDRSTRTLVADTAANEVVEYRLCSIWNP